MMHIATSRGEGRADFDALLRTRPATASGGYDGQHEYVDYAIQEHHWRYNTLYDSRHYHSPLQNGNEEESQPEYSGGGHLSDMRMPSTESYVNLSSQPELTSCHRSSRSQPPVKDRPNYKPTVLRWPFLTSLLVVLLALLGLLAYALHALPVSNTESEVFLHDSLNMSNIARRTRAIRSVRTNETEATTTSTENYSSTTSGPVPPMSADISNYGDVGLVSVTSYVPLFTTISEASRKHGNIDTTSATNPDAIPTIDKSHNSNMDTIPVTVIIYSSPASSNYGNTGIVSVTGIVTGSVSETEAVKGSVSVAEIVTGSVTGADYGAMGGTVVVTKLTTLPQTPTFITAAVIVLTNSAGVATDTSMSIPTPVSTPRTTMLRDSAGQVTATQVTMVVVAQSTTVETNTDGKPEATVTIYPVLPVPTIENAVITVYSVGYGAYFIGMFLPTLLAILISIPIRILDVNAKIFQPWHELTHQRGAAGRKSLCLETSGWQSVMSSVRSLLAGQVLIFLTTLLVLASALLIPISAEAITFKLVGSCSKGGGTGRNCAFVLSVFSQPAKATLTLLAFMGLIVLFILAFLRSWRSGVSTNPWSICSIVSLCTNPDVRRLFTSLTMGVSADRKLMESVLRDRCFELGYFNSENGVLDYGIILCDKHEESHQLQEDGGVIRGRTMSEDDNHSDHEAGRMKHHMPFLMLGYAGRLSLLFVLCGLLVLILYYNNTGGNTPFEHFMDGESFWLRFLFTSFGVIIALFWSSFLSSIATISPYHLLSQTPQPASRSILLSPPTNAFSGLVSSLRRRHPFLFIVTLTAILSDFLPLFLANVPYRVTQTFLVHMICTWTGVGILCIMVLVVLLSFAIKWPHMPVSPSTIANVMYYVCDSQELRSCFEGQSLSMLDRKERDGRVNQMALRYEFGQAKGVSGRVRIGVDVAEEESQVL
ncbi:hypothetical protein F5B20DRAFT_522536 [Whalleya microplaca]|nr:hypothetical protein F5B20DRAFT_522536 [Whalleya microplaca]